MDTSLLPSTPVSSSTFGTSFNVPTAAASAPKTPVAQNRVSGPTRSPATPTAAQTKAKTAKEKARFFSVYRQQLAYFVTQALIFVAALAWSAAAMSVFAYAIPSNERQQMGAKFVYALVLTLASVLVVYLLAQNSSSNALANIADD